MSSQSLNVGILGAGPAGLTLGRLLHLANVPFTIYEGEPSSDSRQQGSTLDLHDGTGLQAVRECGLWDDIQQYIRYDGEALTIANEKFTPYITDKQGTKETSNGRPEVDRAMLRKLLLGSIPAEKIKWDHRVASVDSDRTLHFKNRTSNKEHSLIVGADGAWSKVRPVLTDIKPYYSGISGVNHIIRNPKEQFPDLYEACNRGSIFAWGEGKCVAPQQLGTGDFNMYTFKKEPETWTETCGFDPEKDSKALKKAYAEDYKNWHPTLQKFTQAWDDDISEVRHLYMLPVGIRWDHKPGFTLVGDAAHVMTPFAGEGVNVAMKDSLNLGRAIVKAVKSQGDISVDEMVKAFEEEMFVRAGKVCSETEKNMLAFFDESSWHMEKRMVTYALDAAGEAISKGFQSAWLWKSNPRSEIFD